MDEQEQLVPVAENLVTVATFRDLSEALLAKGKLDSAEIHAVLADDNVVRMDWFWSNLMGGVKLNVPESQAETAYELLFGEQHPAPGEAEESPIRCPKCGSEEVKVVDPEKGYQLAALALAGIPLPKAGGAHWHCYECKADWVDEDE